MIDTGGRRKDMEEEGIEGGREGRRKEREKQNKLIIFKTIITYASFK